MLIAYVTHDEVNAAVAARLARRHGLELIVLSVRDAEQAVAADRLVLDLDHLPPESRSKLFLRAGAGNLRPGVVVHSYNLAPGEDRALRSAGVVVARRLTARTLVPHG